MNIYLIILIIASIIAALFVTIKINDHLHRKKIQKQVRTRYALPNNAKNIRKMIKFKPELPFKPNKNQIIFVDTEDNSALNNYIEVNYDTIFSLFLNAGYTFFFLPRLIADLHNTELLAYNFPGKDLQEPTAESINAIFGKLPTFIDDDSELKTGLIRFKPNPKIDSVFSYFEFDNSEYETQFKNYISMVGEDIYFSFGNPASDDDNADFNFWRESEILMEEVKERIEKLRIMGVHEWLLRDLLEQKPTLSKLTITADYRIMLNDYGLEVKMTPLPKAVFLLFLKHPEGIMFKQLANYHTELKQIYTRISHTDDLEKIQKSIADLTDPSKNAINEKCSRIREAFLSLVSDDIAQHYYITGERNKPKTITLPRENLLMEVDI